VNKFFGPYDSNSDTRFFFPMAFFYRYLRVNYMFFAPGRALRRPGGGILEVPGPEELARNQFETFRLIQCLY